MFKFLFCVPAALIQGIKEEFDISINVECRIHYLVNSRYRLISDTEQTLQKSGFIHIIVHTLCI